MRSLALLTILALAAAPAAQPRAPLTARVPPAWENVLHIGDVVPVLDRMLASPDLERAWGEVADAAAAMEPRSAALSPQMLRGLLALARDQVPTELVIAMPAAVAGEMGALLHGLFQTLVAWGAERAAGDEALADFRDRAADLIGSAGSPAAYAAVRHRDARVAEQWLDWARDALAALDGRPGFALEAGDDRVVLELDVGAALAAADSRGYSVWDRAAAAGFFPAEHAATARLQRAAAALRLRVDLRRDGDLIEVAIGDVPAPPADAPPEPTGDAAPLLDGRWELTDFDEHLAAIADLHFELDERTLEFLDQTLQGRYQALVDRLIGQLGHSPSGRATLTVGADALEVTRTETLELDPDWSPSPIPDSGIAAWAPAAATYLETTSFWTLDEWCLVTYDQVLDTLDSAAAAASEHGFDATGARLADCSARLGGDLGNLYDFLAGEDSALFADGTMFVVDAADDGVPAAALVGLPDSAAAGREFVRRLAELVRDGVGAGGGEPTIEIDLGGGVTAIAPRLAGLPTDPAALAAAAFAPHAVVSGDAVLLSTRVSLTRALLDARARAGAGPHGPSLVGEIKTTGEGILRLLRSADRLLDDSAEAAHVREVLAAAAPLAALIGEVESTEQVEGDELQTRTTIHLSR